MWGTQTPNSACRAELGQYPLVLNIQKRVTNVVLIQTRFFLQSPIMPGVEPTKESPLHTCPEVNRQSCAS